MPSSADPAAAEPTGSSGCELTRTNSGESAITLDASRDLWLRCDDGALPSSDERFPEGKSTEWTNEKHSMYLDSLEASFVHELYHSMRSGSWAVKTNSQTPFSSDQFMALGRGCQKKTNCGRTEPLLDSTADSRAVVESQRFTHFSYSGKCHSVVSPDDQEHVTLRNNGSHSRGKLTSLYESTRSFDRQDLVCSTAEASDQNFADDVSGGNLSCESMRKRMKTSRSKRTP